MAVLKIKRGRKKLDFILEEWEIFWARDTNELIVGDGKTKIQHLKGISNIVKSPNGRLYTVDVDDFGMATVKPMKCHFKYGNAEVTADLFAN